MIIAKVTSEGRVTENAGGKFGGKFEEASGKTSGKSSPISSPNSSPKTEDRIIELLRQDSSSTTEELVKSIGISNRGDE